MARQNVTISLDSAIIQRFVEAVNGLNNNIPANQQEANRFALNWLTSSVIRPAILGWEKQKAAEAKDVDPADPLNVPANLQQ